MQANLAKIFAQLGTKYFHNQEQVLAYWNEIEKSYTQNNRHYHNLSHLENMFFEISKVQNQLQEADSVLFSLFYHDIIHKSTSKQNEEKSAELAKKRLLQTHAQKELIDNVYAQILATKSHHKTHDADTNYLLDSDLAILGKNWSSYHTYTQQIRKEYSIFPDLLYVPGRVKILKNFLNQDKIYKTAYFISKYEKEARENIAREIDLLS